MKDQVLVESGGLMLEERPRWRFQICSTRQNKTPEHYRRERPGQPKASQTRASVAMTSGPSPAPVFGPQAKKLPLCPIDGSRLPIPSSAVNLQSILLPLSHLVDGIRVIWFARLKFELGMPVGFAITALALWLNPLITFGQWAAVSINQALSVRLSAVRGRLYA
jgi:hypothetical protein